MQLGYNWGRGRFHTIYMFRPWMVGSILVAVHRRNFILLKGAYDIPHNWHDET